MNDGRAVIDGLSINSVHFLASFYLKVEMSSRPVVAVSRFLVLGIVSILSPSTSLIFSALCCDKGRRSGDVERLILFLTYLHGLILFVNYMGALGR